MKKIIAILSLISLSAVLFCTAAGAEQSAPPSDGMSLWVDAGNGADVSGRVINKWKDLSGNGHDLLQEEAASRRPNFMQAATTQKSASSVFFGNNQYIAATGTDYSGDASFILYYKPYDDTAGKALFSSHSYLGTSVTESGKIPFSIVNSEKKTLAFKMASSNSDSGAVEYDMNVPIACKNVADPQDYIGLYFTVNAAEKKVSVYYSEVGNQQEITEPAAQFSLEEAPYWESFAYGLCYDNSIRSMGTQAEIAESMIYNRVLSLDEINDINKYLKVKYENPVLERMELESNISEIKKGEIVKPQIIGIGNLMGEESRIVLDGVNITSSDTNIVIIVNGSLKALNFGSARITLSYDGLPDYSFVVNVPQTVIGDAVIDDFTSGGTVRCTQRIENFDPSAEISIIMAAALYKNDLLLDIQFEKADNITAEHTFDVSFTMPEDIKGCNIYLMLLDGSTMAPICDCTIKK